MKIHKFFSKIMLRFDLADSAEATELERDMEKKNLEHYLTDVEYAKMKADGKKPTTKQEIFHYLNDPYIRAGMVFLFAFVVKWLHESIYPEYYRDKDDPRDDYNSKGKGGIF